ncbi:MAG: hypothetical protein HUU23_12850 [Caldilineales bacterium]|nr:hypothetical protein [Caldilineales bacterium]
MPSPKHLIAVAPWHPPHLRPRAAAGVEPQGPRSHPHAAHLVGGRGAGRGAASYDADTP